MKLRLKVGVVSIGGFRGILNTDYTGGIGRELSFRFITEDEGKSQFSRTAEGHLYLET